MLPWGRCPGGQQMGNKSFYDLEGRPETVLDERGGIGAHHLAIGKTRKLFGHAGLLYCFYSTGFEIRCAVADAATREIRASARVPVNAAFGGAHFCIDDDGAGAFALAFTERGRDLVGVVRGRVEGERITWSSPEAVFRAPGPMFAAPWIAFGLDGELWVSAIAREAKHTQIACGSPGGLWRTVPLFQLGEVHWHPSCVQMLPVARSRAIALGFRGDFPTRTELVAREFDMDLKAGEARAVAPCNVNDQLTFQFQAIGDPSRGEAHVAYLDEGLTTSYAHWKGGRWMIERGLFRAPSFAPQLTLGADGAVALLLCDYEGRIWRSCKSAGGHWTPSEIVRGAGYVGISPAFGRTSYGTGGLISAARSSTPDVPYLAGHVDAGASGNARLVLGSALADGALRFAPGGASAKADGQTLKIVCQLEAFDPDEAARLQAAWQVRVGDAVGAIITTTVRTCESGLIADAWRSTARGESSPFAVGVAVQATPRSAFEGEGPACLAWELPLSGNSLVAPLAVTAYSFRGARGSVAEIVDGEMVDLYPYVPEANAIVARDPSRLAEVFRRLV